MRAIPLLVLALIVLAPFAVAGEDEPPPDWKESEFAKEIGKETVARLERDKVVIGAESAKQVFSLYIGSPLPVFITSDSILNAYHVLLSESVVRLERAHAALLPEALRQLLAEAHRDLPEIELDPKLEAAALLRARRVVATALVLLGEEPPVDEAVAKLAAEEAARVEKGEETAKPAWLGPPDPGFTALDYARFRPRGFYDRSLELRRYFRAVSWLQAIPFRVIRDEEFLAFRLLQRSLDYGEGKNLSEKERAKTVLGGYPELLGPGDEPSITDDPDWSSTPFRAADFEKMKNDFRLRCRSRVNDQIAEREEAAVRILPQAATWDAALFAETTERLRRSPPSGLEVAAALGSGYARTRLEEKVGAIVDAAEAPPEEGLYNRYLHCLTALLDAREPDAPELFSGEAWRAKSTMTALAGWAQLRHTWTLQAKQNVYYLGAAPSHAGFVEPDPEFFARLGRLADSTRELLARGGAFDHGLDVPEMARAIGVTADLIAEAKLEDLRSYDAFDDLTADRQTALALAAPVFELIGEPDIEALTEEERTRLVADLRRLQAALDSGEPPFPKGLLEVVKRSGFDLEGMWAGFAQLTGRLETLAHKQLRGVAFSSAERSFIRKYGETLASLMFYGGNSWLTPRDDAPRVVDVFHDPNRGRRLHVGIGRPRPLLVLYPWDGREVLCIGGVMPYYEFETEAPLTDGEWKALLDSDDAPKPPGWWAGR